MNLRQIAFIICFCLDVHVHAISLGLLKKPVEEPSGCLNQPKICGLATHEGTKYKLLVDNTSMILGPKTFILRTDSNEYDFVNGILWVKSEDSVRVRSEYGDVIIYRGEALIEKIQRKIVVKNLGGGVTLIPKGIGPMPLEFGFENFISTVGKSYVATVGVNQLMDRTKAVKETGALFYGSKSEFKDAIRSWSLDWSHIVERASEMHLNMFQRSLAAENAKVQEEARRQMAVERERQRILRLFRDKTL